ncbi:MAG TPA: hypothetical protein ENK18_18405 [Deltaproteobacteria bacterium]|nr:hypothetical protein [Deltaproteobacteria bacterium]
MADVQTNGGGRRHRPSTEPHPPEVDRLPLLSSDAIRSAQLEPCEDDQTTEIAPPTPGSAQADLERSRTLAGSAPPPAIAEFLLADALARSPPTPGEELVPPASPTTATGAPPGAAPPRAGPDQAETTLSAGLGSSAPPPGPGLEPATAANTPLPSTLAAAAAAAAAPLDPALLPEPISLSQPPRLAPTRARSQLRLWQGLLLSLSLLLALVSSGLFAVILFSLFLIFSGG